MRLTPFVTWLCLPTRRTPQVQVIGPQSSGWLPELGRDDSEKPSGSMPCVSAGGMGCVWGEVKQGATVPKTREMKDSSHMSQDISCTYQGTKTQSDRAVLVTCHAGQRAGLTGMCKVCWDNQEQWTVYFPGILCCWSKIVSLIPQAQRQ